MQLLIGSDLVPTQSNFQMFYNSRVLDLLGQDLYDKWFSADARLLNLEAPLTDYENPIDKVGPHLRAPKSTIKGIKSLDPSLFTLANNHIMDHGDQGFIATSELLKEYDIPFLGAGKNLTEAGKPYIIKKNNLKIGVYACAENEFTIASSKKAGANPFDPLESFDHIENLKTKCDYVVVLYHGGKEHYRFPSPYLQRICRKMVEKGASLIVCQHSHCVGCEETYRGSKIVYGQGNFIFDKYNNDFWNTSVLLEVNFQNKMEVEYIPIERKEKGIRLAKGSSAEKILTNFNDRSKKILNEGFVEKEYINFAKEHFEEYVSKLSGMGKWTRRADKYLFKNKLAQRKYNKNQLLATRNVIECEAHRELALTALKEETSRR